MNYTKHGVLIAQLIRDPVKTLNDGEATMLLLDTVVSLR